MNTKKHTLGGGDSYRRLRADALETENVVKQHIASEQRNRSDIGIPWHVFRKTLSECLDTLNMAGKIPGILDRVLGKISEKRSLGEFVTVLDLSGESDASSLGATQTISVALPTKQHQEPGREVWDSIARTEPQRGHVILRGNILSHRGRMQVKEELQHVPSLSFVFFLPGIAIAQYGRNPYAARRIFKVLADAYNALADDGEMIIDLAFLDGFLSVADVRALLRIPDAHIEGGVGVYSSSRGGLWNHITELTIVTMEGDIIICSRSENPDIFRYSLGGLGKIGVIVKFRAKVEKSKRHLVNQLLIFHSPESFMDTYRSLAACPLIRSLGCQFQMSHQTILDLPHAFPYRIGVSFEADDEHEANVIVEKIRPLFTGALHIFGGITSESPPCVRASLHPVFSDKHSAVYMYPDDEPERGELTHLWHDYVLPETAFLAFVETARDEIKKRNLAHTFLKQCFFRRAMHVDMFGGYPIKKFDDFYFPLSLDLENENIGYHLSIDHEAARDEIAPIYECVLSLSEKCYTAGGKKYLYGTHDLSRAHLEKQYGRRVLFQWDTIKRELDPKNLLNTHVIRVR